MRTPPPPPIVRDLCALHVKAAANAHMSNGARKGRKSQVFRSTSTAVGRHSGWGGSGWNVGETNGYLCTHTHIYIGT